MNSPSSLRRRVLLAGASALALGFSTLGGLPAASADGPPPYASGLTNPRGISVGPDGALYVAEAGVGGDVACGEVAEGNHGCLGMTGAVARIVDGQTSDFLTGLPSLMDDAGQSAIGPQDVVVQHGGNFAVSIGSGIEADYRDSQYPMAPQLSTIYSGRMDGNGNVARTRLSDIGAFEATHNPDGSTMHDSDPGGLVADGGSYVVADAGGNTLLHATRGGHVSVLAVFPDRPVDVPYPGFPMQAVPTSVAVGPDGAYYVSQLTGFPFPAGGAAIWRVVPGAAPTMWASGLTNVTDLAWDGDQLYAVQMSDVGLASESGLPMGSLVHVTPTGNSTVASGLPAPYGLAITGGSAYVTACSVCGPGAGFVARIPLS